MSSALSLGISFSGHQKMFPLEQLPKINEAMHSAIASFQLNPSPPQALTKLSDRVAVLTKASELFENAKQHSLRDKTLAMLAILGMVVLVAATVFGFFVHPLIGTIFLIGTFAYFAACNVKALSLGHKEMRIAQKRLSFFPIGLLFGPAILSFMLMTRVSSLHAKTLSLKQETSSEVIQSMDYWGKHGSLLAKRLWEEKQRAQRSFAAMEKLEVRSIQGETDLIEYQELLGRIEKEVVKGIQMVQTG